MNRLIKALLSATMMFGLLAGSLAVAADAATTAPKPLTAQQQRMKSCNADAGSKKLAGDERAKFMKGCLSADAPAGNSQQNKMKSCNADAARKALKGDERKAFMSTCLKAAS